MGGITVVGFPNIYSPLLDSALFTFDHIYEITWLAYLDERRKDGMLTASLVSTVLVFLVLAYGETSV